MQYYSRSFNKIVVVRVAVSVVTPELSQTYTTIFYGLLACCLLFLSVVEKSCSALSFGAVTTADRVSTVAAGLLSLKNVLLYK